MTETNPTTATETAPAALPKPVIFLDFDGVLILSDGEWCPEAMLELNCLCLETGAAVVLTTSFRYSGSVRALHKMMLANGFDKTVAVLGETRDLDAFQAAEKRGDLMFQVTFERWSKGREIAAWLEAHPGAGAAAFGKRVTFSLWDFAIWASLYEWMKRAGERRRAF